MLFLIFGKTESRKPTVDIVDLFKRNPHPHYLLLGKRSISHAGNRVRVRIDHEPHAGRGNSFKFPVGKVLFLRADFKIGAVVAATLCNLHGIAKTPKTNVRDDVDGIVFDRVDLRLRRVFDKRFRGFDFELFPKRASPAEFPICAFIVVDINVYSRKKQIEIQIVLFRKITFSRNAANVVLQTGIYAKPRFFFRLFTVAD